DVALARRQQCRPRPGPAARPARGAELRCAGAETPRRPRTAGAGAARPGPGARGPATDAPAGAGPAAGRPAPDVRAARRGRAELPRGGRHPGHLHRYRDEPALLRAPEAARPLARPDSTPMTAPHDPWTPTPQLLAAYFDGELVGRPELDALRR